MSGARDNGVGDFVAELLESPRLGHQITDHRVLPASAASHAETRRPWPRAIANVLESRGIRLYSHQAQAMDHIRAGHSIVAATPTASGKSLIYNLPVLDAYLRDPEARALYLFPLKALARDQLAAFESLSSDWPREARPRAALYDGDTSEHLRRKTRANPPTALISNPEMLHLAILPFHEKWTTFLANLAYVIVDEAHTYRGVFGSHMAQVFRRLNRIGNRYGARPTYIFCTATLGNPVELAHGLMGGDSSQKPALIDVSGAPRGARHFLFVNPDLAASTCAIEILQKALARGLRTIVYCRSRRMTELISIWAGAESGPYQNKISAYRAGFLADERRRIEADMASGKLSAVITTSALELGIDIGGLDVCILVGYPGTIMQTLQRSGRVGRSRQDSAVIIVAGEDALDQYFVSNPDDFFSRPPERAVINPDNEVILARHLECAAAESPLEKNEPWLASPGARAALASLRASGLILPSADGARWLASRKAPQREVDLRGCGSSFAIVDKAGKIIGHMDGFRVWREAHPGAVYLHRGSTFVIEELDEAKKTAVAQPANVSWFTRVRCSKHTDILEEYERAAYGRLAVFRGKLRITETITGYEKRAASGDGLLAILPLSAPPHVFETEGIWFVIPDSIRRDLEDRFIHFMGSIHALEHALIGLIPLEVIADRNDFGGISIPLHPQLGLPAVFVYDGMPGGAGLARAAYPRAINILEATHKAIAACPCEDGCPSCVHSPKCGSGNRPLDKAGAIELCRALLNPGDEGSEIAKTLRISPAPDRLEAPIAPASPKRADGQARETPANAWDIMFPQEDEEEAEEASAPPERYLVFDVETRYSAQEVGGWKNAAKMGVSVVVCYDSQEDKYFTYCQDDLETLFARMAGGGLLIGFNSFAFDYNVLAPFAARLSPPLNLRGLPGLDLLRAIKASLGRNVSLDNLAAATFGVGKSASGLDALRWWREGKIAEIARYCRQDVELTHRLYLHGLREKYLFFTNKAAQKARVRVNFSHSMQ